MEMQSTMHQKAYAKINWALNVLGTREDGYHLLDMLVQRLGLHDDLYFTPSDQVSLFVKGLSDLGPMEKNLAYHAAMLLRRAAKLQKGVRIELDKHIPVQAGLGGGSADAAAVLLGLNQFWNLQWSSERLSELGKQLGADVPLCLWQGLMRVQGIGEKVQVLHTGPSIPLLILKPMEGLSTKIVFDRFDKQDPPPPPADIDRAAKALTQNDLSSLQENCRNQLQETAINLLPDIQVAMDALRTNGASFALMSGAGSSVFGVFESTQTAQKAYCTLKNDWPVCILTSTLQNLRE